MISKIAALQATEFFRNVTPEALRSLADRAEVRKLEAGEFLFSAGEPCRGLFVVVEGWTRAIRHGADGREQVIHEDGPGSTFPEVAVFDDGPYPSTVVAAHDSMLLFLRKEDVKRFCLAHPEAALSALRICRAAPSTRYGNGGEVCAARGLPACGRISGAASLDRTGSVRNALNSNCNTPTRTSPIGWERSVRSSPAPSRISIAEGGWRRRTESSGSRISRR